MPSEFGDERAGHPRRRRSPGIGRATALTLASSGHRVVLADRDLDGVHETAAMLNDPAPSYRLDIRDREAVDTVIADIERTHGPIDGLAHVAGVFSVASISTAIRTNGNASTTSTSPDSSRYCGLSDVRCATADPGRSWWSARTLRVCPAWVWEPTDRRRQPRRCSCGFSASNSRSTGSAPTSSRPVPPTPRCSGRCGPTPTTTMEPRRDRGRPRAVQGRDSVGTHRRPRRYRRLDRVPALTACTAHHHADPVRRRRCHTESMIRR